MDLIDRQAAIDAINKIIPTKDGLLEPADVFAELYDVTAVNPEYRLDEWCIDCKEYDQERHCCPRFNKVIRQTVDEVQKIKKVDLIEIEDRFGAYVRFVVEDMINGKGERWKT